MKSLTIQYKKEFNDIHVFVRKFEFRLNQVRVIEWIKEIIRRLKIYRTQIMFTKLLIIASFISFIVHSETDANTQIIDTQIEI